MNMKKNIKQMKKYNNLLNVIIINLSINNMCTVI